MRADEGKGPARLRQERLLELARDGQLLFHLPFFLRFLVEARVVDRHRRLGSQRVQRVELRIRQPRGDVLAVDVEHPDRLHPSDPGHVPGIVERQVAERDAEDAAQAEAPRRGVVLGSRAAVEVVDHAPPAGLVDLVRHAAAGLE